MLKKIVSGGDARRTRLHTEENILVPLDEAFIDFPMCFSTKLFSLTGKRRSTPWWPTRVIPVIDAFLRKDHKVIEFGSGSSTIWLGQRAKSVVSIESSSKWAKLTNTRLSSLGIQNARVISDAQRPYWLPPADAGSFDLAIIDGDYRWKCFDEISLRMNRGGLVYLDNSDSDKDLKMYNDHGPRRRAQYLMEQYAAANEGARIEKIRSLIDGELFAGEGMLLYFP